MITLKSCDKQHFPYICAAEPLHEVHVYIQITTTKSRLAHTETANYIYTVNTLSCYKCRNGSAYMHLLVNVK